jgi:hypothetical protein
MSRILQTVAHFFETEIIVLNVSPNLAVAAQAPHLIATSLSILTIQRFTFKTEMYLIFGF